MIRFYDDNSAQPVPEDLQGKIILQSGIFRYRTFGKPGRVTRVSNLRVYYTPISFSEGIPAEPAERFVNISSIGAVCDTVAEASSIINASKKAISINAKYERECEREINALYESLFAQSGGSNE